MGKLSDVSTGYVDEYWDRYLYLRWLEFSYYRISTTQHSTLPPQACSKCISRSAIYSLALILFWVISSRHHVILQYWIYCVLFCIFLCAGTCCHVLCTPTKSKPSPAGVRVSLPHLWCTNWDRRTAEMDGSRGEKHPHTHTIQTCAKMHEKCVFN